ncbi:MAG TPA: hypothetical protein DCZ69_03960 [Syntrophobacteraceae bacterium]|nr:hypothetical protein [Syntrophobacteraceae bacterium]HBD07393.1 hypothetical protein [Syntrophobacteraceae bacterium]HBZ55926.1 hypothetical protein [Syntrophobacteraceae bacterium]
MNCRFHPDRKADVVCNKMEYGYCRECLDNCHACTDPELYCRHRTACVIWEMCRKRARRSKRHKVCVEDH